MKMARTSFGLRPEPGILGPDPHSNSGGCGSTSLPSSQWAPVTTQIRSCQPLLKCCSYSVLLLEYKPGLNWACWAWEVAPHLHSLSRRPAPPCSAACQASCCLGHPFPSFPGWFLLIFQPTPHFLREAFPQAPASVRLLRLFPSQNSVSFLQSMLSLHNGTFISVILGLMPSRYTQCGKFLFISHCCGQSLAQDRTDEWGGDLRGCSCGLCFGRGAFHT